MTEYDKVTVKHRWTQKSPEGGMEDSLYEIM
jgi:hypothetical protein